MRLPVIGRTLLTIALLYGVTSCGGDSPTGTDNNGPDPSISITLNGTTLTITQGENGTVNVTLSRGGGYTGAVSLSVDGAPSGTTPSFSPATLSGATTTSQLTLAVGAAVAVGSNTLTIRAQGSGVSAATATLALNVAAAPTGSFSIALAPTAVSVVQGATAQTMVNITRDNFPGEIAFTASGLPTGLTAAFAPPSTTGNSSALTLTAGANVTPGVYTVTVTGTATGSTARTESISSAETATLQVTVTQSAPGGNLTLSFCAETGIPVWVAYQDGTGSWTQVMPTGNTYTFNISSARGGIAWVTIDGGTATTSVFYGLTSELQLYGPNLCTSPATAFKSVNGSVAGHTITDNVTVSLGSAIAVVPFGTTNFTLQRVTDGVSDLIASRNSTNVVGGGLVTAVEGMIIRRGLNPASGSTLPVLDFGSSEAFVPDSRTLTVNNAGTDFVATQSAYFTEYGASSFFYSTLIAFGATHTFPGIPAAQQATGDLHLLTAVAVPNVQAPSDSRFAQIMFKNSADQTLTLGPTLATITVSEIAGAPYPRLQAMYPGQTEYSRYHGLTFSQTNRQVTIAASSGYAGTGSVTLAVPDFSTAGWNAAAWALAGATQTTWSFFASGWTSSGGFFFSPNEEGAVVRSATRLGTLTTN